MANRIDRIITTEERKAIKQAKKDLARIYAKALLNGYLRNLSQEEVKILRLIILKLLLNEDIEAEDETIIKLLIFLFKAPDSLLKKIISSLSSSKESFLLETVKLKETEVAFSFDIKIEEGVLICEFSTTKVYGVTIVKYTLSLLNKITEIVKYNKKIKKESLNIIDKYISNKNKIGLSKEQENLFKPILFELLLSKDIESENDNIVQLLIFLFKAPKSLVDSIVLNMKKNKDIYLSEKKRLPIAAEMKEIIFDFCSEKKDEKIITIFGITYLSELTICEYPLSVFCKIIKKVKENKDIF